MMRKNNLTANFYRRQICLLFSYFMVDKIVLHPNKDDLDKLVETAVK